MSKNTDQLHPATPEPTQAPKAVPVRSAKDAINAMYASEASNRLSNYLANSAKEIINATSKPSSNHKSAANLHGGAIQRSMESARPSAAGLLRQAKVEPAPIPDDTSNSADPLAKRVAPVVKVKKRPAVATVPKTPPVVRTSLKLSPKRTPIASRPQRPNVVNNGLRPVKAPTNLSQLLNTRKRSSAPVTTIIPSTPSPEDLKAQAIKAAAQKSIRKVVPSAAATRPAQAVKLPKRRGLMQDVVRPVRPAAPAPQPSDDQLPSDSVKRRFRAAPRGYATQAPMEHQFAGYMSDERQPAQAQPPRKPAVEIYGMIEDEPETPAYRPPLVKPEPPVEQVPDDAVPATSLAAPDNNRYALGGQSPFFLKSVNVEKRPLSDAPTRKSAPEGALYQRPSDEPVSAKNVYEKKPAHEKKPIPSKPTVIIPASRRSRAPLILLIIMTIILGAAVGALTYFCFFQ